MVTLLSSSVALTSELRSSELKAFKSDGCSAFPDGSLAQNDLWLGCCMQHDYDYWQGGSYEQRRASDLALQACVAEIGEIEVAELMLAGVRVGGSPYWPTTYRWGYGWPYGRGYKVLTAEERQQVERQIKAQQL